MRQRGFTLIELLVVIAIIGLISTVILASMNSARDKGRMAAAAEFEHNIGNSLSDYMVASWQFNECAGSIAHDDTGNGNDATFTTAPAWSTDTPNGTGCSLSLNVQHTSFSGANLPINTRPYTIAAWIKASAQTSTNRGSIVSWGNLANYQFNEFGMYDYNYIADGWWAYDMDSARAISDNKWHYVMTVWDGTNLLYYIDGAPAGSFVPGSGITSSRTFTAVNVYMGCRGTSNCFTGQIDNLRIWSNASSLARAQQIYAQALHDKRIAANEF